MSRRTTVITILGLVGICLVFLVTSPFLDNRIGLLAGRDLQTLLSLRVDHTTLDEIMSRTYGVHQCSAYHLEGVLQTVVDCEVTDHSGSRVTLSWEISHSYSPHPRIPTKKAFCVSSDS